jgi:23S rRNA (guanine2445-N2)-methyltransferase / 23S rRNA (guanine2069-N7)-methyltransferase
VFDLAPDHIVLKQRKQQRGKDQYQRFAQQGQFLEVTENGCRFLVNLTDYIDTGLFLDHRPLRLRIQSMARGKRFLNLFCYTAAVTVQAAKGGARSTLSVDMSSTYLEWARKNLALNGFSENLHRLTRANCLEWLDYNTEKFDLILLDPPTFSNSKSMDGVLDIQRDHVELIRKTAQHLAPDGILFFSTNFQKFKLDPGLLDLFNVKEISRETIDADFHRQPKIHRVWEIVLWYPC